LEELSSKPCATLAKKSGVSDYSLPPTSLYAIPPAHALTRFVASAVAGASRFAHCQRLRADHVLHSMLGM
jgi:hypothetical protein